jgi:hypothetical protein
MQEIVFRVVRRQDGWVVEGTAGGGWDVEGCDGKPTDKEAATTQAHALAESVRQTGSRARVVIDLDSAESG